MTESQGQWRLPFVELSVSGIDTVATLTTISPANVSTARPVIPNGDNSRWEADDAYQFTTAGQWTERWTVTGTGASTIDKTVEVGTYTNPATTARVYATSADYANELHAAPPTGIRRMLITASRVVDRMLRTAFYDTDDDGYPTDAAHIEALKVATCLQAEFAAASGDKNLVGAARPGGFSIGKIAVQKAAPAATGLGGLGERGDWSPRAWEVLQAAGLTGHEPTGPGPVW